MPRGLNAFREAAAAGAAAAAAGEGAAVTAVTSVLSLTLSIVPFGASNDLVMASQRRLGVTIGVIPARPSDPTGWTGCRYTAGIPGYRRPYRLDFRTIPACAGLPGASEAA